MNQMSRGEIATVGFMMFAIFFGAGNLIFPPALGQAAGDHTLVAMLGFLTTGVGLPLLGIAAIALHGGKYFDFMRAMTYPWMATMILIILYLVIGPLFAMPRTGAVSFEMGRRPFLDEEQIVLAQGIYTAIFYGASYYLALNPNKLIDRIGKMLTPLLLVFLIILFARAFYAPLGEAMAATGAYIDSPFAQGFQDGYQTMDLLASLAIGTIVIQAIRMRGVTENREITKICLQAGLLAVTLMAMVYGSLAHIGATSTSVLGISENGGQLLANAIGIFFGPAGNILVAILIALACLTTCCGITSGTAWFFNKLFKNKISYERLLLISILFSFVASNVGLTKIIALTIPFLVGIYPLIIVFVILSLIMGFIGEYREVYRGAMNLTMVFAILDGMNVAGFEIPGITVFLQTYLPFHDIAMGWVAPAILGAAIGFVYSLFRGTKKVSQEDELKEAKA